jgi:hypothetical protein
MKLLNPSNEILSLSIESKIIVSPSTFLFVFDEEELAKQITLIDFEIYQSIKVIQREPFYYYHHHQLHQHHHHHHHKLCLSSKLMMSK